MKVRCDSRLETALLLLAIAMKANMVIQQVFAVLTAAIAVVSAAPVANFNQIDPQRKFTCPSRLQAFCSASNIHSGCTYNGDFRSAAMDTCGSCLYVTLPLLYRSMLSFAILTRLSLAVNMPSCPTTNERINLSDDLS